MVSKDALARFGWRAQNAANRVASLPIFTPGQLAHRGGFYFQLAQYTAAGVGITSALQYIAKQPPSRAYAGPVQHALLEVNRGSSLVEAFSLASFLPEFDLALIGAGEKSGRLDACFRILANYYHSRAQMARQILSDMAYPVVLFHLAVFLLPFAEFFISGDLIRYLRQTLGVLLPFYAVIALVIWAGQSRHGERWRSLLEILLRPIPVLGKARESLALSRLCVALESLLIAGVTIIEAWALASRASNSPRLARVVAGWRPALESGVTPAEAVQNSGEFPEMFVAQYATGEVSGQLDQVLGRLYHYYHEDSSRKIRAVSTWVPRLFYFAVVLVIAYRVVSFWTGYFQQVQQVIDF